MQLISTSDWVTVIKLFPQMDLSPEIKAFAAKHEYDIKHELLEMMDTYFESTRSKHYEEKWDKGVLEHGPMKLETLQNVDWYEQLLDEAKDAFWYMALICYQKRSEEKWNLNKLRSIKETEQQNRDSVA